MATKKSETTTKVKFLTSVATLSDSYKVGDVVELPTDVAEDFLKANFVEKVK
jgi:hypothetical protein